LKAVELVILIGLQASGKSTFYRARFAKTHAHVSKDLLGRARNRDHRQRSLIESALAAGQSVVVDNTNPSAAVRAPLLQLGLAFGATIVGYYFEPRVRESLARNRQRTGVERVPDVAIYTVMKRLEPPTYAEGFHRLFGIWLTRDLKYEIVEWPREPRT
jgi:predicted kinase